MDVRSDPLARFIEATTWHGATDAGDALLAAHPELRSSVHVAAILGDEARVRRAIAADPASARAKAGARGLDPLTCVCFSNYLRANRARAGAFLAIARALLDAGAPAHTGFHDTDHRPAPEFESAIYGAAGVAQDAALTKLLIEHGADPNDNETPYHAPETRDNAAVHVLVESGRLNEDSVETMLLRKADWHDYEGLKFLLESGADPNRMVRWKHTTLHQALRRDNGIESIELLLDHGADPTIPSRDEGRTAVAIAARRGRGAVLRMFERRGISMELQGPDRLIAACARGEAADVRGLAAAEPDAVRGVLAEGGTLLAEFAGNGNVEGVALLIDLGIDVNALYGGDGYFGIAPQTTALHVAAWRLRHDVVALVIARGARVNARDAKGQTPLALNVRASVDSYWTGLRSPASAGALLAAGASTGGVKYPSGYDPIDRLISDHDAEHGGD